MRQHGFLRVAAASPDLRLADPAFNADRALDMLRESETLGVDVIVFPECGLTGYICGDLFHDLTLQRVAEKALGTLLDRTPGVFRGLAAVGLPLNADGRLFNVAVVFRGNELLGVVPKSYLPNYKEFYDGRFFAPASERFRDTVTIAGRTVPFGTDLLFEASDFTGCVVGVEICEDLWAPLPPSAAQAVAGATVLLNLSASNETIGKAGYRRSLITVQSARLLAAYAYAGAGTGESTTDTVFGGHQLIAENGTLLAESERFRAGGHLVTADIDIPRLTRERQVTTSFRATPPQSFRRVSFTLGDRPAFTPTLMRPIDGHPFVPSGGAELRERCEEIFATQTTALGRRLTHVGDTVTPAIGVSGGLDSTLALLVLCKTLDRIGRGRECVQALTMPGFGTTSRTRKNADALMAALGVTARTVDIRPLCLAQMQALGHEPFGIPLAGLDVESLIVKFRDIPPGRGDLDFENVQARVRTTLLMSTGFVIGTGDLSELALGWCTYNADQMSMYNPNVGVPKTLVKFLVKWAAENEFDGPVRDTLLDVVATDISPELLPRTEQGGAGHATEDVIGPYELHDFFLYHFLRFGTPPEKILFLAGHATFARDYPPGEVRRWLGVFLRRFFANQFKRSCMPDGPKVGSVTLSPRADWRMPSDAAAHAWLAALGDD
jgi:NAD+ synthase (glutamine-hydrolysing)